MKPTTLLTLAGLAALAAGCDRPGTRSVEVPNSGGTTTAVVSNTPSTPAIDANTTAKKAPPMSSTTAANDAPAAPSTAATGPNTVNAVTDTVVTTKVKTAISGDAGMKDADVAVKTENGVVTLTGSAKSPDQVTLAAALAQRQEGVTRVENQVAVR